MERGTRTSSQSLAHPRLVSLAVALTLTAALATAAPTRTLQEQTPSPIVFATVDADWVWEPTPVPSAPANISAPELIRSTVPRHPGVDTIRAGYQGHVVVEATITLSGQVSEPKIVRTPAPGIFDENVLAAVRQWSFRPATSGGVPIAVTGIFTFHFKAGYESSAAAGAVEPVQQAGRRAGAVVMGVASLIPPRQIATDLPEYTDSAKDAGIEGDVYIEAVVTTEGTVVEPELIRGLADEELNRRALEAITRWKFEPGRKDNQPVDVLALFTVTYRINRQP